MKRVLDETVQEDVVILEHLEELGEDFFPVSVVECDVFIFDDLEYWLRKCGIEGIATMSFCLG